MPKLTKWMFLLHALVNKSHPFFHRNSHPQLGCQKYLPKKLCENVCQDEGEFVILISHQGFSMCVQLQLRRVTFLGCPSRHPSQQTLLMFTQPKIRKCSCPYCYYYYRLTTRTHTCMRSYKRSESRIHLFELFLQEKIYGRRFYAKSGLSLPADMI